MTYTETIDYLYRQRPSYERHGANGYKPGLQTSMALDIMFDRPHHAYRVIHVAGTNGKGSVSHMLASMLQTNGYRVGLFTSPHFVDFRERIRVNGQMISRDAVVRFVEQFRQAGFEDTPSFFELTSTMAFRHFADSQVDVAVIEAGLGGRLDSTNIVCPILSVITNVSFDHTEFLGTTLPQIAAEKAGIIKSGVPVVVGEAPGAVREVFERAAGDAGAPIVFAEDCPQIVKSEHVGDRLIVDSVRHGIISCELCGDYQRRNINTALAAEEILESLGFKLRSESVNRSFDQISRTTGLTGRWTTLYTTPCRVICDSAHNPAGMALVVGQLTTECRGRLRMVLGFMRDKDLPQIMPLMPHGASYYFTRASTPRALTPEALSAIAAQSGLSGECYSNVHEALSAARGEASADDVIFVGGSMYVLAELFASLRD